MFVFKLNNMKVEVLNCIIFNCIFKKLSQMEIDKRIEIKQWNAVALWSWNVAVENCAICKNSINESCL
jgi:hypothetical protein